MRNWSVSGRWALLLISTSVAALIPAMAVAEGPQASQTGTVSIQEPTIPPHLIVCPTSHMDWDWIASFNEYYKPGLPTDPEEGRGAVQSILDYAVMLFGSESTFIYNVAEIAWLQRYLVDQGDMLPSAPNLTGTLSLMGGGVTSPDNIVCDGEVFVRNYLLGRQWARSVGLESAVENVSWMPDDFGHDPELPVILSAMGLPAVGFARVPGAFPNYTIPVNGEPSLACILMAQGVAFNWQASDGSTLFAHFMPDTYGVPFHSQGPDGSQNAVAWAEFIQSQFLYTPGSDHSKPRYKCSSLSEAVWPGGIAFAPAGGDFALPDTGWVNGVSMFNGDDNGTTARIGRFSDYVAAVTASGANLVTRPLDPSNFYTGYFGSRPALKILQAQASRDLVAAEVISSLLRLGSFTSSAALDALDSSLTQIWNVLAPSSHHDFVTGTSPDRVYKMEQYPILSLASTMAAAVRGQALQIVADSIMPNSEGTVVAVHNAVGADRGGVFRIEGGSSVSFGASGSAAVQPLVDGGLLVQAPSVPSLGYISGLVVDGDRTAPPDSLSHSDEMTIDNGTIAVTLSKSSLWGITSIVPEGGANVLPSGTAANVLQLYHDTGNLYQYGNEPLKDGKPGIFKAQTGQLTGDTAVQTEFGPLRWRVEAEVTSTSGIEYRLTYTLVAGESMVRMSLTGSAPPSTTVVTTFPAIATDGVTQGTHLIYGTPHHFHEDAAPAYWDGPTFKATHDFLMPAADTVGATFALAAIYHDGMPAWACHRGTLLGSLFRNTDGTQRGAAGTDVDTHTQRYALRISTTPLDPRQGTPLVEALQFANPLRAATASAANKAESPVMLPLSASLASTPSPALIRVARPMGEVPSYAQTQIQGQVALRIYRPDADGTETPVQITMSVLTEASRPTAVLVTALEVPITNAPLVTVNSNTLTVPTSFAVTTVSVTATRPFTPPTNGETTKTEDLREK